MLDKNLQQKIIKKFKGKGGPPDTESSILDHKEDKGHIDVFAIKDRRLTIRWPTFSFKLFNYFLL